MNYNTREFTQTTALHCFS